MLPFGKFQAHEAAVPGLHEVGDERHRSRVRAHRSKAADRSLAAIIVTLAILAISYNAALATVNAHLVSLSMTEVATCEFAILLLALVVIYRTGLQTIDLAPLSLGVLFMVGALCLSFINGQPVVEALRNCAIIVLFTMLGARCDAGTIRQIFGIAVALVFAVMLFELLAVKSYVALFQPHAYFLNTRGLGEDTYDTSGLFPNAIGFEGRFSFGLFSTPRTSSIFLEQTSLANFASVVTIYLVTMWKSLGRSTQLLAVAFVVVALLSNNTRMSSIFAMIVVVGYGVFPLLPRRGTLALPVILLGSAVLVASVLGTSNEDDLAGRIGLTVDLLSITDLPAMLGARALEADAFPDSGYSYILYSSSVVGALALWLYVASIVPFDSPEQKRCAWAVAVFFFLNLLVAGDAVFSMKIAGMLWLLAGFMRSSNFVAAPAGPLRRAVRPHRPARSDKRSLAAC